MNARLTAPGTWLGLLLAGAGIPLAVGSRVYVLQVLGTAAVLLGAVLVCRTLAPVLRSPVRSASPHFTWAQLLAEGAGPLVLGLTLIALYHPLLAGQMPWQADHTVHEAKAWLLAERLIPSGRLLGWTHLSGTGYPAEVLYPPLGDLWMTVVRYATFGQLSFGATYAVGFFGVIAFGVFAFYWMGRRLFGPLAGFLAAVFVLTDLGGFREGGYVFTIQYGVWPLHLGITLSFVTLVKWNDLLTTPGWRHLRRTSLALAAALLAHPVSLLFLLVALPLSGVLLWVRSRPGDEPRLGRAVGAASLGLALAAFWLLPFLVKASGFSAHVSNLWRSMPEVADGILSAGLWQAAWAWPLVLGGLGGLLALKERRPMAVTLFALSGVLVLAGSLTLYTELRLPTWIASARFVQFQRFVIFVKLSWFLLAGFFVQRLFVGLSRSAVDTRPAPTPPPPPDTGAAADGVLARRAVGWVTAALIVAPFVLPLAWRLVETRVLPVGRLTTAKQKAAFRRDFRAVLAKVCAEVKRKDAPFFRVGFLSGFNDHEMANARTFCPLREVKLSFIPSETFKYRAHLRPSAVPRSREDFQALNLRYVVTNGTRRAPGWLTLLSKQGRVALYEVPDYQPQPFTVVRRVTLPDGGTRFEPVPRGRVSVRVTRFTDEEVRVAAKDVPPDHFLVLHVAHFANWRAERGGRTLPLRAYDGLAPRVRGLMMVPLAAGTTVFRYRSLAVDHLGRLLTLSALLFLLALFLLRRRPGWAEPLRARLERVTARARRPARWAVAGLAVLAALALLAKASGLFGGANRPRSLAHDLGRARVSLRGPKGHVKRCRIFQMGRWICGEGRRWVGPVAEEWNLKNRFGLWAHPDDRATLVIEFPGETLGRALEVDYGILQSGGVGAPVTLTVLLDGRQVGEVRWPRRRGPAGWASTPLRVDTRSRRGQRATVRFEVRTSHIGGRHFVFDPRVVP